MDTTLTKVRLLEIMQAERDKWDALLAQVGEERMTQPGVQGNWSVKDIVAHIIYYERAVLNGLERIAQGKEPEPSEFGKLELEERNDAIYKQSKDRSLEDLLQEENQIYRKLTEFAKELSESDLLDQERCKVLAPRWYDDSNLWDTISGNSFEHYHEHVPDIRSWLQGK